MCVFECHCGVDPKDLCLAIELRSLMLDVAEALVALEFVKVG
jgi:hypothetical protein